MINAFNWIFHCLCCSKWDTFVTVLEKKLKFTHTIDNRIIIWNRDISTRFRKRIPRPTGKDYTLLVKKIGRSSFGRFIWDVKVSYTFFNFKPFWKKKLDNDFGHFTQTQLKQIYAIKTWIRLKQHLWKQHFHCSLNYPCWRENHTNSITPLRTQSSIVSTSQFPQLSLWKKLRSLELIPSLFWIVNA